MKKFVSMRSWLLVFPAFLFLVLFFLIPLLYIFVESFISKGGFSFFHYQETFSDSAFRTIYFRSIKISFLVTLLAVALGYPSALVIAKMRPNKRAFIMSLIILPLMVNSVARTFAWFVIMGRFGLINQFLSSLSIINHPVKILFTEQAIIIGLLQLFFPLMVLPLVSALENLPAGVEEAARSLGASKSKAFFRIVFPLSTEGLVLGGTLVFTGSITAYTTPAILGGNKVLMLSTLLYQKSMVLFDWGGATVVSIVMLLTTIALNRALHQFKPKYS